MPLSANITSNKRENSSSPEEFFKYFKHLKNIDGFLVGKSKNQHEVISSKKHSEEAFSAFATLCSDNSIYFNDRCHGGIFNIKNP